MEGCASNFKEVLADFQSRLAGADFVAIDTELTGVDIEGEPDGFEDTAQERIEKMCRIAERYTLIQLGLTIVGRAEADCQMSCASYNLFAFPYVGPELLDREPGFYCQASALKFNSDHKVNFNTWINEGIPYMSREDEKRYLQSSGAKANDPALDGKVGLLRLWKALCNARLPFVVHCPLDLFFLLAAFERRQLPKADPKAMALMIRQCTPKVYDTAHLHGAIGAFKRLGLTKFHADAKARYDEMDAGGQLSTRVHFQLEKATGARYSKHDGGLAHEAGFDSLLTGQLFALLRAISPTKVKQAGNRLFLYRSVDYIDLDLAAQDGVSGVSIFDQSRITLLVIALDPENPNEAPRSLAAANSLYRWLDTNHILVILRASGGAAVRKAAELAKQVHGVEAWIGFEEWREKEKEAASARQRRAPLMAARPGDAAAGAQADVQEPLEEAETLPLDICTSEERSEGEQAEDSLRSQNHDRCSCM